MPYEHEVLGQFEMKVVNKELNINTTVTGFTIEPKQDYYNLFGSANRKKHYPTPGHESLSVRHRTSASTGALAQARNVKGRKVPEGLGNRVFEIQKYSGNSDTWSTVQFHAGWSAASSEGCLIVGPKPYAALGNSRYPDGNGNSTDEQIWQFNFHWNDSAKKLKEMVDLYDEALEAKQKLKEGDCKILIKANIEKMSDETPGAPFKPNSSLFPYYK